MEWRKTRAKSIVRTKYGLGEGIVSQSGPALGASEKVSPSSEKERQTGSSEKKSNGGVSLGLRAQIHANSLVPIGWRGTLHLKWTETKYNTKKVRQNRGGPEGKNIGPFQARLKKNRYHIIGSYSPFRGKQLKKEGRKKNRQKG